jgi:hypothetical protein
MTSIAQQLEARIVTEKATSTDHWYIDDIVKKLIETEKELPYFSSKYTSEQILQRIAPVLIQCYVKQYKKPTDEELNSTLSLVKDSETPLYTLAKVADYPLMARLIEIHSPDIEKKPMKIGLFSDLFNEIHSKDIEKKPVLGGKSFKIPTENE